MAELQTLPASAVGGLDLVSPPQLLAKNPGMASMLENYEPLAEGGYRKIKGYTLYSTLPDAYKDLTVRGIYYYKGIVVVIGTFILHSYDGSTWYEVNKTGMENPTTDADSVALPLAPRQGTEEVNFQGFLEGNKDILVITDDKSNPAILYFDETSKEYTYKVVPDVSSSGQVTTSFAGYKHVTKHKDHIVLGNSALEPGSLIVSQRFKSSEFTGQGSLSLKVTDEIIGIKTFRDYLYIFCRHSIYRVQNLEQSQATAVAPVTTKVGCVSGKTIQEIGGDVLFLSDDGLRYLGATERIDDVSLNLVSAPVRPLTDAISIPQGPISSVVLPEKAQYRLFYTNIQGHHVGLIGTLSSEGRFIWSTTSDMNVMGITDSHLDEATGNYLVYHIGKNSGVFKVYQHDLGESFGLIPYKSTWKTPYFNMGDPNVRKALHDVTVYLEADDRADIELTVKFDFENPRTLQPAPFFMAPVIKASRYGTAIYNEAIYGALRYPLESLFLEGSGKWVQFTFKDNAQNNQPYVIRGFDVQFNAGGRI